MSGYSSSGYRPSSGFMRRSDLYNSQSSGRSIGDEGGYTTTSPSHRDGGGNGYGRSSNPFTGGVGYRPRNSRSYCFGYSSSGTSSTDSGSLSLSSSVQSYSKGVLPRYFSNSFYSSGVSSGRVSNSSYRTDSSSGRVSNSSYRTDSSSGRVNNSSYRTDSSSGRVGNSSYSTDSSSGRVSNSSYNTNSSSGRVSNSSCSSDVSSGYVSSSSYNGGVSSGHVSNFTYNLYSIPGMSDRVPACRSGVDSIMNSNSPYDDSYSQSGQMRRGGQRSLHLTTHAAAMGRDEHDDCLLPTPSLPMTVTHPSNSETGVGRDKEDDGLLPTPRLSIADVNLEQVRKRGWDSTVITEAVAQLSLMGSPESILALNIMNTFLGGSAEVMSGLGESPPNKRMRMDMRQHPSLIGYDIARAEARKLKGCGKKRQKGRRESSGAAKDRTPSDQRASSGPGQTDLKGKQSSGSPAEAYTVSKESVPLEALKCYVCERDNFSSVDEYLAHLEEEEHMKATTAYNSHGCEVRELIRRSARLSVERQLNEDGTPAQKCLKKPCRICECKLYGSREEHIRTVEHRLLNQWRYSCCGYNFADSLGLEKHLLSLLHLKRTYKPRKGKEPSIKEKDDKESVGKDKEPANKVEDVEVDNKDKAKVSADKEGEKEPVSEEENKEPAVQEEIKEDIEPTMKVKNEMSADEEESKKPEVQEEDIEPTKKVEDEMYADEEENKEPLVDKEEKKELPIDKVLEYKESEMEEEEEASEEAAWRMFTDAAVRHRASGGREVFTSTTLPPYDPKIPMGLHFLAQKSTYQCRACPSVRLCKESVLSVPDINFHFHTHTHYLNMFNHLVNKAMEEESSNETQEGEGVLEEAADDMVEEQDGVQGSGYEEMES